MKSVTHRLRTGTAFVTVAALVMTAAGTASAAENVATKPTFRVTVGVAEPIEWPGLGVYDQQIEAINYPGELDEDELTSAFEMIESIPDSALLDGQAFEQWKVETLRTVGAPRASIDACAWGITKALAANIFVFSKVAKLKTIIKEAGGARAVAKTAVNAYDIARHQKKMSRSQAIAAASEAVSANGGEQALSLLLEFFSIDGVVSGCFSD
ncbi:hypothetical protein [Corynebacterium glucuronolyticum]|uniref:hypothetical protein n=1 Tax=Corynebacterium glucuronolyticum TaxID=39791 RepID=UPI00019C1CCF|nr:hypothetical protein [Corynebacterium glucuronolyticum]EEI27533.1 Gram-positive signal peptide protein, YSIRK family [Corynebacterium glucuronolyticum ATCC 51867]QRO83536.1 hypothetical protein I6J20_05335 [Corynebacterium glucuronolyticum]